MATAMAWSLRTHRFTPLLLPAIVALACSGDDGDTAASTSSSTSPTTGLTTGTTTDSGGTETASTSGSGSESDSTTASTESTTGGTETDTATTGGTCAAGQIVCDGDTAQTCDGEGGFTSEEACDSACAPGLGCVECVPVLHEDRAHALRERALVARRGRLEQR